MSSLISRRAAVVGGVGGAAALTLTACGNGGGAGGSPAATLPTRSEPAGGAQSGASTTDGLAALDSITVGEAVAATMNGRPVLVARPTRTTAACFSAICTHQGCTVAPAGTQLRCPCHGSIYDATTGAVISGPAPRALDRIPVQVADGTVVPAG